MSTLKKIVIGLVVFIIATPLVAFGYFYFKLNSIYDSSAAKDVKIRLKKQMIKMG